MRFRQRPRLTYASVSPWPGSTSFVRPAAAVSLLGIKVKQSGPARDAGVRGGAGEKGVCSPRVYLLCNAPAAPAWSIPPRMDLTGYPG